MTGLPHVCRHCDEPIADPDDAVYLGHEEGASGPGWEVWAHRAHIDLVGPDPTAVRIMAHVLIARAMHSE